MGRPATGSARNIEAQKLWIARVTLPSGEPREGLEEAAE